MGIDYVIDWDCAPKQMLSTPGILARLKARDRAAAIIQLYRENGDERPPSEMGFEMARRSSDGTEEVRVVIVQELLDEAAQLGAFASHCSRCPANVADKPFGCFGSINYPISAAAERWLLRNLPISEEPLPFLLLREILTDLRGMGDNAAQIRSSSDAIFETKEVFGRRIEGSQATTNHIFTMLFLGGAITPTYGAMLMLFFHAIRRDMEADELKTLTPAPEDFQTRFPFLFTPDDTDDSCIGMIKQFFGAMYLAYGLNITLSLDV